MVGKLLTSNALVDMVTRPITVFVCLPAPLLSISLSRLHHMATEQRG
jgi:hypothetical protein